MKKILVPVDIMDKPINLIRYAIAFSQQFKCKLIFFYADLPLIPTSYTNEVYTDAVNADIKIRERVLHNMIEKNRQKLQVKTSLLHYECRVKLADSIDGEILEQAEKDNVDMILLATHGRSGLRKLFFGSVASAVISNSRIPVLAIPLIYKFRPVKKLIYATDLHHPALEIALVKSIGKGLHVKIKMINLNFGFTNPDESIIELVKAEGISYQQFMRRIEYTLADDLKSYMKNQPNTILSVFKHHKAGIENFLTGNKTAHLAEGIKFPLLTLTDA